MFDDVADEGVSVGVDSGGFESKDDVTRLDAHWVDGSFEFEDSDAESGEVVVVFFVEVVHLGGFSTDECASGLFASVGDAFDDGVEDLLVDMVDGDVVEEEEGLGALDDEVVDIHRDEVDSDGVVFVHLDGEVDLGSYAVGACNEDGVGVVVFEELFVVVEAEESCESSGVVDDSLAVGPAEEGTDGSDELVAGFDVDS